MKFIPKCYFSKSQYLAHRYLVPGHAIQYQKFTQTFNFWLLFRSRLPHPKPRLTQHDPQLHFHFLRRFIAHRVIRLVQVEP